jgi:apolipoprotein N-acyltransferase
VSLSACIEIKNIAKRIFFVFPRITALCLGGLAKFCFCRGTTVPLLLFPMFMILLFILKQSPQKNSFGIGFSFGFGYFASTLYWIAESFKCVGLGNYGYIAVAFLVFYISIYPGIVCYLTKRFATTPLNFSLFFSVFWVLGEYFRGAILIKFPWNLLGYSCYNIPYFSQIADIFGVYGISFIILLTISFFTTKKTLIYGISLLFITIFYGYYKINLSDNYTTSDSRFMVTLIQPSITHEDKNNANKIKANIDRHISISSNSKIYHGKRLVIWPEAAVNILAVSQKKIWEYIASSMKYDDCYIIAGHDRFDENGKLYNSLCVLGKDAKIRQIYDKRHLLPFGEFIPEFFLNLGLRKMTSGIINFSEGKLSRAVKIDGVAQFEVLICYEIAFPGEIVDASGSEWILNITNDSWFNESDGPIQHMKTSCFRAIEEGKPVIRCANNGISCIIDCNGRILKSLKTNEIGKIDVFMPKRYQETFFSIYNNKTILAILMLFLAFLFFSRRY